MSATLPRARRFTHALSALLSNFDGAPRSAQSIDCLRTPDVKSVIAGVLRRHPVTEPLVLKNVVQALNLPAGNWTLPFWRDLVARNRGPNNRQFPMSVACNVVEQGRSAVRTMDFGDFIDAMIVHFEKYRREIEAEHDAFDSNADAAATPTRHPTIDTPGEVLPLPADYMYVNQNCEFMSDYFPELTDDLRPFTALFPTRSIVTTSLWLGPSGSVTGLHCDHDSNVLFQVYGSKTVLLVDRLVEPLIYPSKKFDPGATLSSVDLRRPAYNRVHYPNLRHVVPIVAHLGPGDMLPIPKRWYHFVYSTAPSCSVAIHATTPLAAFEENATMFLHNMGLWGTRHGCTCHSAGSRY